MNRWITDLLAPVSVAIACLLATPAALALSLSSPAFNNGGPVPVRYSCDGVGVSPPLTIADVPDDAQSLALLVEDPDAPSGTFVHWVVYNLPAKTQSLAGGAAADGLPSGAVTAHNSYRQAGYGGLCPPAGQHHYVFTVFALDERLDDDLNNAQSLIQAMRGHQLGRARLTGIYRRQAGQASHHDNEQ